MKKIFVCVLAAFITASIATTAFAAEIKEDTSLPASQGTKITYKVVPSYTVTIPQTIELTKQGRDKIYAGSGVIKANTVRINYGYTLDVKIYSDFKMSSPESATQSYTVTKDADNTPIVNGATIAQFDTKETEQSVKLNYASPDPKYAGEYSDTVTFNIAMNTHID